MQHVINSLYNDFKYNLNNISKTTLRLSDRILLEKALSTMEAMKKVMDACTIKPNT